MLVCLLFDGNATGNSDFSDLTMASVVASFCLGPIDGAIVGALLTRRAFRRPHDD
jgi:energy-converting hydrogenase Eha subunit B